MEQEYPRTFGLFHGDGPQGRLWQEAKRSYAGPQGGPVQTHTD